MDDITSCDKEEEKKDDRCHVHIHYHCCWRVICQRAFNTCYEYAIDFAFRWSPFIANTGGVELRCIPDNRLAQGFVIVSFVIVTSWVYHDVAVQLTTTTFI